MIEITNINPLRKGDLLATVTVHIKPWKLKINEVKVFEKGAARFVSLPARKYEANGETKWAKLLEFDDIPTEKRFRDQILKAVDDFIEQTGDLVPEDVIKPDEEIPF